MVRLATTPDAALQQIVDTVTSVSRPALVLLFGSRAAGTAREDSDYHLMLVFPDDANVDGEAESCRNALRHAGVQADILTSTVSRLSTTPALSRIPGVASRA